MVKLISFIVGQRCMNDIVNGLFWDSGFRERYGKVLEGFGYFDAKDFQRLGDELYGLNARGTGQRYNDERLLYSTLKFRWVDNQKIDKWQVLKSMHCLQYQCYEGDTDETGLFKFLRELINLWEDYCIESMKEYQEARWGE